MNKEIKLLVFDVFGTVVDWRGSVIAEGKSKWKSRGVDIDWGQFVDQWRAGYQPAMDRIRKGEVEWENIDHLHRQILDKLLTQFDVHYLTEEQKIDLNRIWHRLKPWDDAATGLQKLRQHYTITTLSNGNMSLLVNLSKYGNLHWDCILSAELAKHYKPDLETYQIACDLMDVVPEQAMMIASHRGDLLASQQIGMHTAFVQRPLEYGLGNAGEEADASFDLIVTDFHDLAEQLTTWQADTQRHGY
ncbi:MAG: haloacid dehalogenase type II [Chloroflexota bacterium]